MASARLLTKLFRSDNIAYKIRPVSNFSHIEEIVPEVTATDIKTVVMINCGAVRFLRCHMNNTPPYITYFYRYIMFQTSSVWNVGVIFVALSLIIIDQFI